MYPLAVIIGSSMEALGLVAGFVVGILLAIMIGTGVIGTIIALGIAIVTGIEKLGVFIAGRRMVR